MYSYMTAAQRIRRQHLINGILSSQNLEGRPVSDATKQLLQAFAEGRLGVVELQEAAERDHRAGGFRASTRKES